MDEVVYVEMIDLIKLNNIYELMKIISKKISTVNPTMSIVDSEKGTFWPLFTRSRSWFHNIQDNRHSIFIVVADKTLIRIGGVLSEKNEE